MLRRVVRAEEEGTAEGEAMAVEGEALAVGDDVSLTFFFFPVLSSGNGNFDAAHDDSIISH
jgi:hypothetical protein